MELALIDGQTSVQVERLEGLMHDDPELDELFKTLGLDELEEAEVIDPEKEAEAVAEVPDLEQKLEGKREDIKLVSHHIREMDLELSRLNADLILVEQNLIAEVQLLQIMKGQHVQGADEKVFEKESKVESDEYTSAEADKLSKALFKKVSAKVHPDKKDPRFAGMFEKACMLRRKRDVNGLKFLWHTVKTMSKSGSYLLSRLYDLRKQLADAMAEYDALETGIKGNMLRNWKEPSKQKAVVVYHRNFHLEEIDRLRSQIDELQRLPSKAESQ